MAVMGVMTAVISILGPLSIPIGLVPISFTNLAIFIALYTLGRTKGTLSTIICYEFRSVWLAYQTNISIGAALALGVIPFIAGILLKLL